MRSMKESSPFSSPQQHSKMRVTITGMLQGILCLLYELLIYIDVYTDKLSPTTDIDNILFTVIHSRGK
ncbi:unnamed protein product [Coregonus sp. 'balchen']|nr:unnamed protein product [Coregonus sp. 'balchen']